MLRGAGEPFQPTAGLRCSRDPRPGGDQDLGGEPEQHVIEAPARVFDNQEELQAAFKAGELDRDFVAVVRFQGPRANGMPELHKLTPPLGVLQDRGLKVALVTDGRMSGRLGQGAGRDPRHAGGGRAAARSPSCATATSSASTRRRAGSRSRSPTTFGPGGRMPKPTFPPPMLA